MSGRLPPLRAVGFVAGLGVVLCGPGCATVPPGSGGVVLRSSGVEPAPLGEGTHWTGFFSSTELYDLRQQEQDEDLGGISADGASLMLRDSLVTYAVTPGELVALAREIGEGYYQAVIRPVVQSTVRRVLASYRVDQLDTPGLREAQERITAIARERLRPFHLTLTSVLLRGVFIDAPVMNAQIEATAVAEQHVLEERHRTELAAAVARARVEEAQGIAAAHRLLAPTLAPQLLESRRNQAWERLLTSPTTRVEVTSSPVIVAPEEAP